MRDIENNEAIGLMIPVLLVLLVFLSSFLLLRNISCKSDVKEQDGKRVEKGVHFSEPLTMIILVVLIAIVKTSKTNS